MQEGLGGAPTFESGRVLLSTGDLEVLKINLIGKEINVNVEDKAFIKRILKLRGELTPKPPETDEVQKSPSPLAMLRTVAETLSSRGLTLTVSYRGNRVVTLGANAKPTLLQLITKTRAVALNSLYNAIRMII